MNPCELVAFISAVACTLAKQCSEDELTIMAAAFTQLGDTLATILTQEEICNNNKKENKDDSSNLSPAASYGVLSEKLIKDSSVDQDLKSLIEKLNKEHIKVLQSLENATLKSCD